VTTLQAAPRALAVIVTLFSVWVLSGTGTTWQRLVVSGVAPIVLGIVVCLATLRTARRPGGLGSDRAMANGAC
jgi:hypothetical protein